MGVLSIGPSTQPLHEVEAFGHGHGNGVAVEDVDNNGVVTVGGELVGHELGVLPDAEDVGDVEEGDTIVLVGALRLSNVSLVLANLGEATGGLASVKERWTVSYGPCICLVALLSGPECRSAKDGTNVLDPGQAVDGVQVNRERGTYSCLTPTVQHFPGGLEAIVIRGVCGGIKGGR